ncbi:MAG TPA: aminoacyl-tRNA hydrolase [Vicinamibacterales bacterium]|nr:aminoacyl-tRNA hydrolase [Vicinamibacterales bacterium]
MRLVVGLGNPGPQYRDTRHNVGFWVVDEIARRWNASDSWRERDEALFVKQPGGAILVKPLTFMNLSGLAVSRLGHFFQVAPSDMLVVADEVALPLGRLRARPRGSAGGHNGLKSLIAQLGTDQFGRLRVGVGRGDTRRDLADHVLSTFDADERETIQAAVLRAADASEMFISEGIDRVMSSFNAAE